MSAPKLFTVKRLSQAYYVCWAGLTVLAVGYLVLQFMTPSRSVNTYSSGAGELGIWQDVSSGLKLKRFTIKDQKKEELVAQVKSLKTEIAELQEKLADSEVAKEGLEKKVAQLQREYNFTTASIRRPPGEKVPEIAGRIVTDDVVFLPGATGRVSSPPKVRVDYKPLPGQGFADEDFTEQTISPVEALTQEKHTAQTQFAVDLGSNKSVEEVRYRWWRLKKKYASALGSLEARYIGGESDETPVSLIAGPFESASAALEVCASLVSRYADCQQTIFTGKPL